MIRESDNTAAELLVRELGVAERRDGSTPAGTQAVADALPRPGLPTDGLRLGDGSGLEATNQSTCALLAAALRTRPSAAPRTLAAAGRRRRSGTLRCRLVGTPLEGKLRAKTGSLNGVTGLTGFSTGAAACRSPSWPTAPSATAPDGFSRTGWWRSWPVTPARNRRL